MEAMFDRMDAFGKSMLGLTIQCAQCHNHKYDPISQQDYYRLFAFLNNDHEPQAVVYTPAELMERDELARQIKEIEAQLLHTAPDWEQKLIAWESQIAAAAQPSWEVLAPTYHEDTGGGAKLSLLPDNSLLCAGYAPTHCTFRVAGKTGLAKVTALRLELLTDANLPRGGPGRSFKGTCALSDVKVEIKAPGAEKATELKIVSATADFEQPETPLEANFDDRSNRKRTVGSVSFAIDDKKETAWGIDQGPGRRNQARKAVFRFEQPTEIPSGAEISVSLLQDHGGWNSDDHQNNLLGRFRVSFTADESEVKADPLPERVREILATPRDNRSEAQLAELFSYWRTTLPEWKDANDRIETLWSQWPQGTTALVLAARETPRATNMLRRGDFLKPGEAVAAGVPEILHSLPENTPPTRLSLANWLVDRRSPTTARVAVNRIWQAYFGTGIVATSEDLGVQSDTPSHPQLLDWLACSLMDSGWSMKALHRLIVQSATYQQSSNVSTALYEKDPNNRLLARGARFRVEGEVVRDIALAASGRLNPKLGGPSIFAPIPQSLLGLSYAPLTWDEETGADRYRRGLYTFRRRSLPYPALQNFDTPNGDFSCVRRQRSNTPLQALTTLNEVVFTECARSLAKRTLHSAGPSEQERLAYAFRLCVSRPPNEAEQIVLAELLHKQLKRIADGWTDARQIATGESKLPDDLPPNVTPAQLAAYTVVARVILNLDETITKE